MAMFIEVAVNDKAELSSHLSEKRWDELRSKAHEVKGYAASFGYPLIAAKMESALP